MKVAASERQDDAGHFVRRVMLAAFEDAAKEVGALLLRRIDSTSMQVEQLGLFICMLLALSSGCK